MKEYIDFNTKLRTAAKNDFEKDFYKFMNNSVFGKMMERHRNIKLMTNREAYLKTVMKPKYKSGVLFGENLMVCEMGKIKFVMNKLIYLGQAILDLSNTVMYKFYYDYMKQKYPEGLTLCDMDTDSLIYDIETEDFYKDIAEDRFDTNGYNPHGYCVPGAAKRSHRTLEGSRVLRTYRPLPVRLNKKVIGLMKDELGGEIMTEFVALRPKMYAYKTGSAESTAGLDEVKKCKGIKK